MNIIHLSIIDSTNDEAQRRIAQDREATNDFVIRADFQTDGRGQRGNIWESESRKNLMFSYVFYPKELAVNHQFMLSQATASALPSILKAAIFPTYLSNGQTTFTRECKKSAVCLSKTLFRGSLSEPVC